MKRGLSLLKITSQVDPDDAMSRLPKLSPIRFALPVQCHRFSFSLWRARLSSLPPRSLPYLHEVGSFLMSLRAKQELD